MGGLRADLARAARDVAGEVGWRRARLRRGGRGRGRLSSLRERCQKRAGGAGEAGRGSREGVRKSKSSGRCESGGEGRAMGARTALERSPPDHRRRGCPAISPRPTKLRSSSTTPRRPLFRRFATCQVWGRRARVRQFCGPDAFAWPLGRASRRHRARRRAFLTRGSRALTQARRVCLRSQSV